MYPYVVTMIVALILVAINQNAVTIVEDSNIAKFCRITGVVAAIDKVPRGFVFVLNLLDGTWQRAIGEVNL